MIVIRCGTTVKETEPRGTVLEAIRAAGIPFDAPCGGRGTCGKCRVYVQSPEAGDGWVPACRTRATDGCTVFVPPPVTQKLPATDVAAIDIGTTNVCAAAIQTYDDATEAGGAVIGLASVRNAQAAFGADVMSRITAAKLGDREAMRDAILAQLADLTQANRLYIVGNTVMLHLLWNEDPSGLGVFPFTPAFTEKRSGTLRIPGWKKAIEAVSLPCLSAFIGSDVLAGAAHLRLADGEMLVDLGTNCEMIFKTRGRYYACSAAAGPALEGAGISCGMGGETGGIDSIFYDNGLRYTVIGGGQARGVTGSGLFDAVAYLRTAGLLDEAGRMDDSLDGVFRLGAVSITQKDIRAFQLAKAAVRAGIELLCKRTGAQPDRIFLAGGMGLHLNTDSARATGLLPAGVAAESVGNAALDGCIEAACDERFIQAVEAIRAASETVRADKEFSEMFIPLLFLKEK